MNKMNKTTAVAIVATLALAVVMIGAPPAAGGTITPYATDSDTAVLYHLDEATGTCNPTPSHPVVDSSGNGQNLLTIDSVSPFDGVNGPSGLGTSMTSDGPNSKRAYRLGNADLDGLFNTETFTIEAWIRNPSDAAYTSFFRIDRSPGVSNMIHFGLDTDVDQLRFAFLDGGNWSIFVSTVTLAFEEDTWHHVAVTYDNKGGGTANDSEVKFFFDSENDLGSSGTRPGTQLGDTITNVKDVFSFGGDGDIWVAELEGGNFLNGDIDEVRYSNVVRSDFNLAVPEPGTVVLLLSGLLVMALVAWRRKK